MAKGKGKGGGRRAAAPKVMGLVIAAAAGAAVGIMVEDKAEWLTWGVGAAGIGAGATGTGVKGANRFYAAAFGLGALAPKGVEQLRKNVKQLPAPEDGKGKRDKAPEEAGAMDKRLDALEQLILAGRGAEAGSWGSAGGDWGEAGRPAPFRAPAEGGGWGSADAGDTWD